MLCGSWWVLRSESLYESFLNFHVLVKGEQELHVSWQTRVCMTVFSTSMSWQNEDKKSCMRVPLSNERIYRETLNVASSKLHTIKIKIFIWTVTLPYESRTVRGWGIGFVGRINCSFLTFITCRNKLNKIRYFSECQCSEKITSHMKSRLFSTYLFSPRAFLLLLKCSLVYAKTAVYA